MPMNRNDHFYFSLWYFCETLMDLLETKLDSKRVDFEALEVIVKQL